jgi:hypothetical protein
MYKQPVQALLRALQDCSVFPVYFRVEGELIHELQSYGALQSPLYCSHIFLMICGQREGAKIVELEMRI